jgi:hypothetical protein
VAVGVEREGWRARKRCGGGKRGTAPQLEIVAVGPGEDDARREIRIAGDLEAPVPFLPETFWMA